jgi:galactonate dehydratase
MSPQNKNSLHRREAIGSAFKAVGLTALSASALEAQEQINRNAPIPAKDNLKITKLETFLVKPRWLFLKIHTNAGIVGLGEPITEGRALTCATAVKEVEPYLVGKDPRPVAKHWQAIYRHAFYRGGPILTSALSGIDQALWDIKGKALGVPVYELLGGPTRDRVRVYAHASRPDQMKSLKAKGFTAFKTGVAKKRPARYIETPAEIEYAKETFAELRQAMGKDVDIAIDFHGAISPATAKLLIRAYEPCQPMFIEEPCQAQNVDTMAEIARGTYLPIATGERLFTKWGFKDLFERQAAAVIQPDICHAGGILELKKIAAMAETYYIGFAPHNPNGPICTAASIQVDAAAPNFLIQEFVISDEPLRSQLQQEPYKVIDGYFEIPNRPGLGVEINEEYLDRDDLAPRDMYSMIQPKM